MFDSIDAMNSEELLVRRKRGSKRHLIVLAIVSIVFLVIGILIGYFSAPRGGGGSAAPIVDSFDYVKFMVDNVDKDRIRSTLQNYSSEPRLAGTEKDYELALQIERDWKDHGLDEVHLATYYVRLSFPNMTNPNVVQVINTTSGSVIFESHKYEVPLTEHENNSNVVPPFNGFSPAGNVTSAKMVYVNYGRIEDFQLLKNKSVNVTGCIAIARYGHIYRGDKLRNGERFGAIGMILFSDPADYNLDANVNHTYPHSWWLPPSGIQRGTVGDDGDADTPLYPSTSYAYRLPEAEVKAKLPTIPMQPIGYNDADILLRKLSGEVAPSDWQGHLNFTYHLGPALVSSDIVVRVIVNNYDKKVVPVYNVIGYITGSEEPDRYVLMGNHHDAWVFGAVDPLSGSAAITELTRMFGLMLKEGHRPRRTIVFCSWDAEEYGLLGSVEWVEDHLKLLHQRAVAYLNMDYAAVATYTLAVGTTPLLQDVLYSVAKKVPAIDPQWNSMYDQWKARPRTNDTSTSPDPQLVYSLGSGSDMAAFYQRAGVPAVDMWVTYDEINITISEYPLYHSSYETFFAFDNYIDPGFHASKAITTFLGVLAAELACSELIPMRVERYSAAIKKFHETLTKQFEQQWKANNVSIVSIDGFSSAVQNFTDATQTFQKYLDDNMDTIKKSPLAVRRVNDQLIFLERAFLDPEGLPGRPAQKHVVFAPSVFNSYVDNSFPGIGDTMAEIEKGIDKWEQLRHEVYVATYIVQSAANTLQIVGL